MEDIPFKSIHNLWDGLLCNSLTLTQRKNVCGLARISLKNASKEFARLSSDNIRNKIWKIINKRPKDYLRYKCMSVEEFRLWSDNKSEQVKEERRQAEEAKKPEWDKENQKEWDKNVDDFLHKLKLRHRREKQAQQETQEEFDHYARGRKYAREKRERERLKERIRKEEYFRHEEARLKREGERIEREARERKAAREKAERIKYNGMTLEEYCDYLRKMADLEDAKNEQDEWCNINHNKAEKMLALANRGIDGEKSNAIRMLTDYLSKFSYSIAKYESQLQLRRMFG